MDGVGRYLDGSVGHGLTQTPSRQRGGMLANVRLRFPRDRADLGRLPNKTCALRGILQATNGRRIETPRRRPRVEVGELFQPEGGTSAACRASALRGFGRRPRVETRPPGQGNWGGLPSAACRGLAPRTYFPHDSVDFPQIYNSSAMQLGSLGFLARPERSSALLFGGTFNLHGRGVYAHLSSRSDYFVFFWNLRHAIGRELPELLT